ncbi:hypothetical protein NCS52_01005600 [Fusarium sp. LHS14.1]|nr:hypothetical protein NCS52_01005600 [Fusarium sp. LHS14.1]
MEPPADIEALSQSVAALSNELKSVRRRIAEPERRQEPISSVQRVQPSPVPIEQLTQQATPGMAIQESERVASTGDACALECSNCGMRGHNKVHCLLVPEGRLAGCIFCHTQDHNVDECSTFQNMSLGEQVSVLVHQRSRLPPLETRVPWVDWLRNWLSSEESRDAHGNTAMPSGYPWSEDFTKDLALGYIAEDAVALQPVFDESRDHTGCL